MNIERKMTIELDLTEAEAIALAKILDSRNDYSNNSKAINTFSVMLQSKLVDTLGDPKSSSFWNENINSYGSLEMIQRDYRKADL